MLGGGGVSIRDWTCRNGHGKSTYTPGSDKARGFLEPDLVKHM